MAFFKGQSLVVLEISGWPVSQSVMMISARDADHPNAWNMTRVHQRNLTLLTPEKSDKITPEKSDNSTPEKSDNSPPEKSDKSTLEKSDKSTPESILSHNLLMNEMHLSCDKTLFGHWTILKGTPTAVIKDCKGMIRYLGKTQADTRSCRLV